MRRKLILLFNPYPIDIVNDDSNKAVDSMNHDLTEMMIMILYMVKVVKI